VSDQLLKLIADLSPEKRAFLAELLLRSVPDARTSEQREPIAIIGISCRFPGGANTPARFWQLLREGGDAITEVPADRWDSDAYYDADPSAPGKMSTRWGGFLEHVELFDADFFGIAPREAVSMDPQQRLLLELAWEALEDAGQAPTSLAGSKTGVFIGIGINDYSQIRTADKTPDPALLDTYAAMGNAFSIASNRLSYFFNFHGPSISIDTACSSSLVAVHLACQSLWSGEALLALVGGVNMILLPENTIRLNKLLAPDGHCKAFDARANGYVRGEGAGIVVLKPLSQAQADGDPIYAVIRGSAVNQDGRSSSLTVPNGPAQESLIREALHQAGVKPSHIGYVEAHGTGTALGDPIEANALGAVLAEGRPPESYCLIGAVKTNIGHLEAAAGIAGLIKTALMLKHREIPPSLHFEKPNPHIDFSSLPLRVPQTLMKWPEMSVPACAGVSAFGFGGTNAHVVLQEFRETATRSQVELGAGTDTQQAFLLPLSARSPQALRALAQAYQIHLSTPEAVRQEPLGDICYTASVRRSHHEYRLALAGSSHAEIAQYLTAFLANESASAFVSGEVLTPLPGLTFVFSGQGGQWVGMGCQLLTREPVFRAAFERCDDLLRQLAGWSLLNEIQADEAHTKLEDTQVAQPVLFALQVALAALWNSWGIVPDAVVGHSVGEISAAYVAGILSLEDALTIVYQRGRLMQRAHGQGAMLALGISESEALRLIADYPGHLELAAINSPVSVVLTGEPQAIEEVCSVQQSKGIFCRKLSTNYAFHSFQMDPFRAELEKLLTGIVPRPSSLPFYSTVSGQLMAGQELEAAYWGRNLREPVRFSSAIQCILTQGTSTFVEVGPHPALTVSIEQNMQYRQQTGLALPSLRRTENERTTLLSSLGALYSRGYKPNWQAVLPRGARCVALPTYPWQRQRYWVKSAVSTAEQPSWYGWLYEIQWVLQPPAETRLADTNSEPRVEARDSWLILADKRGVGQALARLLEARGHHCVLLTANQQEANNIASYRDWFAQHILATNAVWRGVVHLWGLDGTPEEDAMLMQLDQMQNTSYASILALTQVLLQCSGPASTKCWLVTQGVHVVETTRTPPAVAQAPLWGLGRVLALEQPATWGGLIDLDPASSVEDAAAQLMDELSTVDGEDQVAWRSKQRFVARVQQSAGEQKAARSLALQPDGYYLITGGLGTLGLRVARWLIEGGARHILLLNRRGTEGITQGSWQQQELTNLRQSGAQVEVLAVDVGEEEHMTDLFKRFHEGKSRLRGIIHLAGVAHLQPVEQIEQEDLAAVLRSKVRGGWLLHSLSANLSLDFCVFFSSVASIWGSRNSASYAAANAFLDALAHYRNVLGLPACVLNWGPWATEEGGMATQEAQRWFARMGMVSLAPEAALAILDYALVSNRTQQIVAHVKWDEFLPVYSARRRRPLFEALATTGAQGTSTNTQEQRKRLEAAAENDRHRLLLEFLQAEVQQVLGRPETQPLGMRQGFFEAGMDSLMAVELQRRLQKSLGGNLPATLAFDYPTVEALADYLAREVLAWTKAAPATAVDERSTTLTEIEQLSEDEAVALMNDELTTLLKRI
jgi:acyl transferase domain-containing protein